MEANAVSAPTGRNSDLLHQVKSKRDALVSTCARLELAIDDGIELYMAFQVEIDLATQCIEEGI